MFKRILSVFLLGALLCVLSAPAFAAKMQEGSMYVNTANGRALRFRASKKTESSNIIAEIPYGTKVYVLEYDSTWAKIRYNGVVGYVVNRFLTIARPLPRETVLAMREAEKAAREAARKAAAEAAALKKEQEAAAREAAALKKKQEAEARKAAAEAAAEAELLRKEAEAAAEREKNALRIENGKLDQSKVKTVDEYDVTVCVGVVDLAVKLYKKPNLTSEVIAEYMDGVRLVVRAQNRDWALVYNGASDVEGYMLLENLEPDLVENVLLED